MKRFVAVFALFSLVSVAPALSATPYHRVHAAPPRDPIKASDSQFWLAVGGTFINYKEPLTPPTLPDSERGWMPSGAVGISKLFSNRIFLAVNADIYDGPATYRGAFLITPTVPLKATTDEQTFSFNAQAGYAYNLSSRAKAIPYAEVGVRHWERALSASQIERYSHTDLLGGLMLQYAPVDSLIFTAYGAAGMTAGAVMKTDGFDYELTETMIYKLGGRINYSLSPHYDLFTSFDFQHFRYGRSPVQINSTYEPSSFTNEMTSRIGVGYKFN